jgi:hypothetical protein
MRVVSCLFFIVFCLHSAFSFNIREEVASVYHKEIGVREKTGNNDGKEVEKYLAAVGLGKGYSWCAAFVSWCLNQKEVPNPKSAWVPNWFPSSKLIYKRGEKNRLPKKADLFGIYFPEKKRIAHIGFVDDWQEEMGVVITVEGNTNEAGSREGDGVYRKRRLIRQIYAVSRWIEEN